jgi:hypothetical protein
MRTPMLALTVLIGLCVVAGSGSAMLQGQGNEKRGDGDYETPGGSGTIYLTFEKVS